MANCCRIYVDAPLEKVKSIVSNLSEVIRWGNNPIRNASESAFGNVPAKMEHMVEINCLNKINSVCLHLSKEFEPPFFVQDLDGYGYEVFHWVKRV